MKKIKLFISGCVFAVFVVAALSCGSSDMTTTVTGAQPSGESNSGTNGSGKDDARIEVQKLLQDTTYKSYTYN